MLSIKFIREHKEAIKASEERRDHDPQIVDQVLRLDEEWRSKKTELQELQKQRNIVSEEINALMKEKKMKKEKENLMLQSRNMQKKDW